MKRMVRRVVMEMRKLMSSAAWSRGGRSSMMIPK